MSVACRETPAARFSEAFLLLTDDREALVELLEAHARSKEGRILDRAKMGQRDLRRLLITGAMAVVRWSVRRGRTEDPWLARMLACKPRMLVAVALANRMARIAWALMTKREVYRARALEAA